MSEAVEAVIIGSGFGGAITACRLARKWPGKVVVLERGKRYPMGSFPRAPHDLARNFWCLTEDKTRRPPHVSRLVRTTRQHQLGMIDARNYDHMDVVLAAGLGGGSLIYANVFLIPPDEVFDSRWPGTCKKSDLVPYYQVAKDVLGSRPIPPDNDPRRRIIRTHLFEEVAKRTGRNSSRLDINVFFGNDFQNPLPIGQQDVNRYGALQTSCVYCAECIIGCNYHSKNTLDLNYLYMAENVHQADIRTKCLAVKIVPVNARADEDPSADGEHGYRVYYKDLRASGSVDAILTKRVVVSAGTLGSTELLLRAKLRDKTLPRISDRLGHSFSGNGDFLEFVLGSAEPDPNYGPTITQRIDHNLFQDFQRNHAFVIEDASYPALLAWFVEGFKPRAFWLPAVWRFLRDLWARVTTGKSLGRIGYALEDILSDDISFNTCVLLCMGLDKSNGVMRLDENANLAVEWPYQDSLLLYTAILEAGKQFRDAVRGEIFMPLANWDWPIRNNITVHPLGGCVLGDDPTRGVTSSDRSSFGQVFGYKGLYVADGAIVPTAVGANPTATISALSEMVGESITGIKPDAKLV
ncbi:MAG TPA: GMC oxidoreductase [Terriglobia bacterium]|nr:GMC oxidoreductase [Terriglobia bacterium]